MATARGAITPLPHGPSVDDLATWLTAEEQADPTSISGAQAGQARDMIITAMTPSAELQEEITALLGPDMEVNEYAMEGCALVRAFHGEALENKHFTATSLKAVIAALQPTADLVVNTVAELQHANAANTAEYRCLYQCLVARYRAIRQAGAAGGLWPDVNPNPPKEQEEGPPRQPRAHQAPDLATIIDMTATGATDQMPAPVFIATTSAIPTPLVSVGYADAQLHTNGHVTTVLHRGGSSGPAARYVKANNQDHPWAILFVQLILALVQVSSSA